LKTRNPFSGIFDNELAVLIVPKYDVEYIKLILKTKHNNVAIELLGKEGRGKTTHLKYYKQQLKDYPLFELSAENRSIQQIINHPSECVMIDSIHHLSFRERIQLFKAKKVIIYTTHHTRYFACKIAKKPLKQLIFKNIDNKILQEIVNKRLAFFENKQLLNNIEINALINKYGDNYRFIINNLYTKYNE
jgi:energy-coupling factor transporter ATP-binding protein EcfA2